VALTYSAKHGGRGTRSAEDMGIFVAGRLPGLCRTLTGTGVSDPRPLNAAEVAEMVAASYAPSLSPLIDGCRADGETTGIEWATAGPSAHIEAFDHYAHDEAVSATWAMAQAPKSLVSATVLESLLTPLNGARKRVTLVYRPHDAVTAAAAVDRDVRTAIGRASARKGVPRASEVAKVNAAHQAAAEEAAGAGVVRFALMITATVTDPTRLRSVGDAVDQMGRASRIRLRRCYGSQSAAFAASLGVGMVLPYAVAIPEVVRDYL